MSTQKEETRVRLLEAAHKLLLAEGFSSVSLEEIAREAGVSRQAVYKSHFASKADLLLALVQHSHVRENLDELTVRYFAASSGTEMLEECIRAIVLIQVRVHEIARALVVAAYSDAAAAAAVQDRLEVQRGALRKALQRVECEGLLSPAWPSEQVVNLVSSWLSFESYERLVVREGWSPDELIDRVWRICQATFLTSQRPHARRGTRTHPRQPK